MAEEGETRRFGLLGSAMEELLERTRAVADAVGSIGSDALGAIPEPLSAPANRMLGSLRQVMELVPPVLTEFDALVEQLHAQRKSVQALQAQLSAFDRQLEVVEKSLAPLQGLAHQWSRLQQTLLDYPATGEPKKSGPSEA
ncbi:hypothetical protein [Rhodococcus aetherivorans]|uniref:hypothetical protein n=1 Tax=Rhodococcus aetherivorans TaxID=191292 RepID=UPI00163AE7BF|nr:hypothetical protein [Rhodococcus aetherivorans]MBC2591005.1 hypothetical protein [Rhodococcus aetherivorans]